MYKCPVNVPNIRHKIEYRYRYRYSYGYGYRYGYGYGYRYRYRYEYSLSVQIKSLVQIKRPTYDIHKLVLHYDVTAYFKDTTS